MKKLFLILSISLAIIGCNSDKDEPLVQTNTPTAKYKVEVNFNWSEKNFPKDFPKGSDHFSPLIGWVHDANTSFFKEGTLASTGIKSMAETGATAALESEINAKLKDNKGYRLVKGKGLGSGVGNITVEIEVAQEFPLVTLSTMIAPSPDWYVAVVGTNLFEDNSFVTKKTVNAYIYDAGTDSGVSYKSANKVTSPKGKITKYTDNFLGSDAIMATVTFTKL